MAYPSRPSPTRVKKPSKGIRKPSSEHIAGRRKTWMSLGNVTDGRTDLSPRIGLPWWKSPMFKSNRAQKADTRK